MAGKFTNTQIVNELDSVVEGFKDRLQNPYYNWNAMYPTSTTYLNINKENTTFDQATGLSYAANEGSFKYNKINGLLIYGIEKVLVNFDNTDEGTSGYEITEDAVVLPNTIIPYPGDHFTVNYVKEELLFRVIEVQPDTLDNGANAYKFTYKLITTNKEAIKKYYDNVVKEYKFMLENVGTGYNCLLLTTQYDTLSKLDEVCTNLRIYYKEIFYSKPVQSFIFNDRGRRFYDSYLTNFLISTGIISSHSDFMYLDQQVLIPDDFSVKYNRTFFNVLTKKDKNKLNKVQSGCYGIIIDSKINIFSTRYEDYFNMEYQTIEGMNPTFLCGLVFDPFDDKFLKAIIDNTKLDNDVLSNMIIKYFNDEDITEDDIKDIDNIDMEGNMKLFYYVPCVLYIMEYYIKKLMTTK